MSETGEELPPSGSENDEDFVSIFGPSFAEETHTDLAQRTSFRPWHHPVKQIVRELQWAELTKRLIQDHTPTDGVLRYFTLPGPDLLDVRALAKICAPADVRIEYFGLDSSLAEHSGGSFTTAAEALRQAQRITDSAVVLPDRLEDIAIPASQAQLQLKLRQPFHAVNLDVCDHLAYTPERRPASTFDALRHILVHQMTAKSPWLLFVTTRVSPELLGDAGVAFQGAIDQNLLIPGPLFREALHATLESGSVPLETALASYWITHDMRFLKLYTIGFGKFLLQFFHSQPNHPANVELISSYAYRVYNAVVPDMLAIAFRITPEEPRVFPAGIGGAALVPVLEVTRAAKIAARAERLWNIDEAFDTDAGIRRDALEGTSAMLADANFSIEKWRQWLAGLPIRSVAIDNI
jgi:hypothetical protein